MTNHAYLLVAPAHLTNPPTEPGTLIAENNRFAIIERD